MAKYKDGTEVKLGDLIANHDGYGGFGQPRVGIVTWIGMPEQDNSPIEYYGPCLTPADQIKDHYDTSKLPAESDFRLAGGNGWPELSGAVRDGQPYAVGLFMEDGMSQLCEKLG